MSELSELSDPESPLSDGTSRMSVSDRGNSRAREESDAGSELSELSEETVILSPISRTGSKGSKSPKKTSGNGSKGKVRAPSTARAPSTKKPNKRRTPVLERASRVYVADQPDTPRGQKQGSAGVGDVGNPVGMALGVGSGMTKDELEIDLEELGLEDKEIPPDKLVKLEKIGSGGFKEYVI